MPHFYKISHDFSVFNPDASTREYTFQSEEVLSPGALVICQTKRGPELGRVVCVDEDPVSTWHGFSRTNSLAFSPCTLASDDDLLAHGWKLSDGLPGTWMSPAYQKHMDAVQHPFFIDDSSPMGIRKIVKREPHGQAANSDFWKRSIEVYFDDGAVMRVQDDNDEEEGIQRRFILTMPTGEACVCDQSDWNTRCFEFETVLPDGSEASLSSQFTAEHYRYIRAIAESGLLKDGVGSIGCPIPYDPYCEQLVLLRNEDKTWRVSYCSVADKVVIPATGSDGQPVTTIDRNAFHNCMSEEYLCKVSVPGHIDISNVRFPNATVVERYASFDPGEASDIRN